VDSRNVFQRDPDDPRMQAPVPAAARKVWPDNPGFLENEDERIGYAGPGLFLKAGSHRMSVEQDFLSTNPKWNEVFRPVWRRPGAGLETLPLEQMRPLP